MEVGERIQIGKFRYTIKKISGDNVLLIGAGTLKWHKISELQEMIDKHGCKMD